MRTSLLVVGIFAAFTAGFWKLMHDLNKAFDIY